LDKAFGQYAEGIGKSSPIALFWLLIEVTGCHAVASLPAFKLVMLAVSGVLASGLLVLLAIEKHSGLR